LNLQSPRGASQEERMNNEVVGRLSLIEHVTIKNRYHLLRIDDLMDQLNQEFVFSNISPKT